VRRCPTPPPGQNQAVVAARFTADPAVWARFNPLHRGAAQKIAARVHRQERGHEFALIEQAVPLVLAAAADFFHKAGAHETEPCR
jgi:hypothetical protein